MKECRECKEVKNFDEFYRHKISKDGYRNVCKVCSKKYSRYRDLKNPNYQIEWRKQSSDTVVVYDTWASKLVIDDNPSLCDDGVTLQVDCKYCGKTFKPGYHSVIRRIKCIEGNKKGESNFYCSDSCKSECPIFHKKKYISTNMVDRSREVQPHLRKMVLRRDNYTCKICGLVNNLHCHHYDGIEVNPIESADTDNCITLCKSCHKKIHKNVDCSMRRKPCKPKMVD